MRAASLLTILSVAVLGCAHMPEIPETTRAIGEARLLPALPAEELADDRAGAARPDPEAAGQELVTLTAVDANVRTLLPALADAAGVSLVLPADVGGTVSLHLEDVPARAALDRTLAAAGLQVIRPLRSPWPPTTFRVPQVDVSTASADVLRARFGISERLARYVVESRKR